jgi:hypothetical protein
MAEGGEMEIRGAIYLSPYFKWSFWQINLPHIRWRRVIKMTSCGCAIPLKNKCLIWDRHPKYDDGGKDEKNETTN